MASLVVDASAVAGWILPDETGPDLSDRLADAEDVLAPTLFWAELRNILLVGERRGRLERADTDQLLASVEALALTFDASAESGTVMELARRHGLTVYDALYLELALRRGASLVSLDRQLVRAAETEGCAG